jgi:hypothetical protein
MKSKLILLVLLFVVTLSILDKVQSLRNEKINFLKNEKVESLENEKVDFSENKTERGWRDSKGNFFCNFNLKINSFC